MHIDRQMHHPTIEIVGLLQRGWTRRVVRRHPTADGDDSPDNGFFLPAWAFKRQAAPIHPSPHTH